MNATKPPPDDLKAWSKNELVRECRRLRAITREHAERRGDDPREQATTGAVTTSPAIRTPAGRDARRPQLRC
jgi:hypothetical protein